MKYRHHPIEERLEAVKLIKKGLSYCEVERRLQMPRHQIIKLVAMYERYGYEGLLHPYSEKRKITKNNLNSCKSPKKSVPLYHICSIPSTKLTMGRPKKKAPQTELEKLREENEYLRTELALIKKVRALMAEKDARLLEIGRKSSNH